MDWIDRLIEEIEAEVAREVEKEASRRGFQMMLGLLLGTESDMFRSANRRKK